MQFICEICEKTFRHKSSYRRHMRAHTEEKKFKCDMCEKRFRRVSHLRTHQLTHSKPSFPCNWCNTVFIRNDKLEEHRSKCDGVEDMCFVETDAAFERR